MATQKLHVPAFRNAPSTESEGSGSALSTDGKFTSVVVIRWGRVAGFTFRAGDHLVLDSGPSSDSGLLLLRPVGYGWPMLGRRRGGRLVAEPGGVPAATQRWRVAARVVGVERSLGRSVTDRGRWHVAVRPRGTTTVAALEAAGLTGGSLTNREVDALCHRAARWMDGGNGSVSVGVATSAERAAELVAVCPAGRLRIEAQLPPVAARDAELGDVVVGPWGPRPASAPAQAMQAADGTRFDVPARLRPAEAATPAAQLSLFGSPRSHRAS